MKLVVLEQRWSTSERQLAAAKADCEREQLRAVDLASQVDQLRYVLGLP